MNPAHPASERCRRQATLARVVIVASLSVVLGGCYATTRETAGSVPPPPSDYRLRHPISIREKDHTVLLFVGNSRGGLTPPQRADVAAFAQEWKREATGGVVIEVPAGTPNARAAADTVHEVESILFAAGLPPGGLRLQPYQPADPRKFAVIRLNYPRIAAEAGPCGLWPEDLGPSLKGSYIENRPYYNLGCATQRNLAAMVDNPADLVQPRGETPAYTGRRTTALDKYRQGQSTATAYPDANKGQISDVGK